MHSLLLLSALVLSAVGSSTAHEVASPRNVTFVRTIFSDNNSIYGFRDPSPPVFDGQVWHAWATRILGSQPGYAGEIWHLYSEELDAEWKDGGVAVNRGVSHQMANQSDWDSYGVFTPSIAWEAAGGEIVPAPNATKWYLFFGGVSHLQPAYDEAIGVATASSPFGPWEKISGNPIITGRDPVVPWCDREGPGPNPGILHVDEAEPYVLRGERFLFVKTVCKNHTVLPSVFRPMNPTSWLPPYKYDANLRQPMILATATPTQRGFEQARIYSGPDGLLHLSATAYDDFQPHFVSEGPVTVGNCTALDWELVEKFQSWGESPYELTPVYPADAPGAPGDAGGVPRYFLQFASIDSSAFHLDLLQVHWKNISQNTSQNTTLNWRW